MKSNDRVEIGGADDSIRMDENVFRTDRVHKVFYRLIRNVIIFFVGFGAPLNQWLKPNDIFRLLLDKHKNLWLYYRIYCWLLIHICLVLNISSLVYLLVWINKDVSELCQQIVQLIWSLSACVAIDSSYYYRNSTLLEGTCETTDQTLKGCQQMDHKTQLLNSCILSPNVYYTFIGCNTMLFVIFSYIAFKAASDVSVMSDKSKKLIEEYVTCTPYEKRSMEFNVEYQHLNSTIFSKSVNLTLFGFGSITKVSLGLGLITCLPYIPDIIEFSLEHSCGKIGSNLFVIGDRRNRFLTNPIEYQYFCSVQKSWVKDIHDYIRE
ncbi:unnamed protein product, partial [Medioppia subpectinata]